MVSSEKVWTWFLEIFCHREVFCQFQFQKQLTDTECSEHSADMEEALGMAGVAGRHLIFFVCHNDLRRCWLFVTGDQM